MADSRAEACTAQLDREEGLSSRCVIQLTSENEGEAGELEVIEMLIGG